MDFALTTSQRELRDTAGRWLATRAESVAHAQPLRHDIMDESGWTDSWWAELTGLGWLDDGLGVVETALVAEQAAAVLLGGPWFATVALAAPALRAAGQPLTAPATLAWAEPPPGPHTLPGGWHEVGCRAEPAGGGWRLTGQKRLVPQPDGAVVVVATGPDGLALYLVAAADARPAVRLVSTVDQTRPVAELALSGVPARLLVGAADAADALIEAWRRAGAILAAEAVGIAQRALDIAVRYAGERTQFGRPIGGYQAVSHRLAEVAAGLYLARPLAYRAAWCVQEQTPDADEAVITASLAARQCALDACDAAVQTLGGNGFGWEHPLRRLYRRARWIVAFDSSPQEYRTELAHRLIDG